MWSEVGWGGGLFTARVKGGGTWYWYPVQIDGETASICDLWRRTVLVHTLSVEGVVGGGGRDLPLRGLLDWTAVLDCVCCVVLGTLISVLVAGDLARIGRGKEVTGWCLLVSALAGTSFYCFTGHTPLLCTSVPWVRGDFYCFFAVRSMVLPALSSSQPQSPPSIN